MIKVFFASVVLCAWAANAQTIAGVVRDTSCAVLPGAQVVLKGDSTERQAITDVNGAFAFRDLAEPRYSLHVALIGFYQFDHEDVLPSVETSKSFEIRLPLSPLSIADPPLIVVGRGERMPPPGPTEANRTRVRILDQDCQPVREASVELRGASAPVLRTDAGGWTSIPPSVNGRVEFHISAAGFVPVSIPAVTVPFRFRVPLIVALRRGQSQATDILDGRPPMLPTIRIVAMGDSTTAGTPAFMSPRESPPSGRGDKTSQYAYWLMKAHPEWQVVNQGVNGQRSDEIRARFEEDVVAKKPAVVVIIAGVNDVYQGRPAQQVKDQLAAMYKRAHAAGIHVVAGTIIPYDTATPEQNQVMHDINTWIRAQARTDPRVTYVDTRAAVASPRNADRLFSSPDGLHPDAVGYRRMAEAIAPAIESALGARH